LLVGGQLLARPRLPGQTILLPPQIDQSPGEQVPAADDGFAIDPFTPDPRRQP
jgi:hypothetical protein